MISQARAQAFCQRHGDGVGFLAGGAGAAPDPDHIAARQLGQDGVTQELEMLGFPEEVGFVGGQ